MNFKQAKEIDIVAFLSKKGYYSTKVCGIKTWYLSPLVKEKTASFNVNTSKNIWHCFSTGLGGNIIDLVMNLYGCTNVEALNILSSQSFFFHQQNRKPDLPASKCHIIQVKKLNHPVLINYINQRKINPDIARKFCYEIYYSYKKEHSQKPLYSIGFLNDKSGYEIRNKKHKGCINIKSITTILAASNTLCLFEGFIDFLSYLTLKKRIPQEDFVILNSTNLVEETLPILQDYEKIKVFFDNDESGKTAFKCIQEKDQKKVIDCSIHYSKHNDLNEYLIAASN